MKSAAKRITFLLWLALAAFQLLFAAQVAPAKSAFVPENRVWKIFPLAAQTHQLERSQLSQPQRERGPPLVKTALDVLLGPESETSVPQSVFAYQPGPRGFVIQQDGPLVTGNQAVVAQGDFSGVMTDSSRLLPPPEVQSTAIVPYSGQPTPTSWPGNDGALGDWTQRDLQVGMLVDRYGDPRGTYLSPYGTPFANRALPPENINSEYNVYQVISPFSVNQSIVAPAFGAPGLGTQFKAPFTIQQLIEMGYLKPVK
jgi:hypothetical protein